MKRSSICDDVRIALSNGDFCEETDEGVRFATHCLYPSFDPVEVVVTRMGDSYIVSDAGGAKKAAWLHGREEISKALTKECARFSVDCRDGVVEAKVTNIEWLKSAILGVANASASAVAVALARSHEIAEHELVERIYDEILRVLPKENVKREGLYPGNSGKKRKYDFVAVSKNGTFLVNAVTPNHISISSKFVSFADLPANDHLRKVAVYDRPLETPDAALITQVADLMPVSAIENSIKRMLA
jgi:hypothetical protein